MCRQLGTIPDVEGCCLASGSQLTQELFAHCFSSAVEGRAIFAVIPKHRTYSLAFTLQSLRRALSAFFHFVTVWFLMDILISFHTAYVQKGRLISDRKMVPDGSHSGRV